MDLQSLFNTVSSHLLTQNAKSVDPDIDSGGSEACAYRGANGTMCAAGVLIPNEAYTFDMEGSAAMAVFNEYSKVLPKDIWNWPNIKLIGDLQCVHDNWDPAHWPERLAKVAKEHDLNFEPQGTNHQP